MKSDGYPEGFQRRILLRFTLILRGALSSSLKYKRKIF
jgi:hypothetical protein